MSGIVDSPASDLRQRLNSYDAAYVDLLDRVEPILRSGRAIDLEHTLDVLNMLRDFLDGHPEAEARHDVLIPAALLHDCGWSEVPEAHLHASYGDVRPDNPGKIEHQPSLFWALVEDGTMTLGKRIGFLEEGIETWFGGAELAERARRLLGDRKREAGLRPERGADGVHLPAGTDRQRNGETNCKDDEKVK